MSTVAASHKPISTYRPPPHRSLPPIPPRWAADERAFRPPPLAHFVLLSMLLHILAILLFGAPSGGSREGRAMWGSLDVVITGPFAEPTPMLKLDRGQLLPMLAPPRRAEPPPKRVAPTPTPAPVPRAAIEAPPPAPPQVKSEPLSIPPLLNRLTVPDRKLEMEPAFKVPPPRERPAPPAPPAPSVEAPPPKPPEPAPAARIERVPAEAPPVAAPLVQPLPPPPVPVPPPAPVERAPVETPALPATPTPPVERPPVEVPVLPVPESASPARIEPAPKPVEKPVEKAPEVAPTPAPVPTAPPTAIERAIERAQGEQRAPAPRIENAPPASVAPGPSTSPAPTPFPREREGRGGDFPGGRSDYDPTKGGLDLDAMRNRAAQLGREGSGNRALLPFPMPAVEKPKSKLEAAIDKARKPDCKEAYKDLGLAAVIPLVANEFGEGNCRW